MMLDVTISVVEGLCEKLLLAIRSTVFEVASCDLDVSVYYLCIAWTQWKVWNPEM